MTDWAWDQWLDQYGLSIEDIEDEYEDMENDCNA